MKSRKPFQWVIFALGVLMLLAMVVSVRADDDGLITDDDDGLIGDDDDGLIGDDDDDGLIGDDDDDLIGDGCPNPRKGMASGNSEITTTFDCPKDDGKLYATSSGEYMYIQCCTDRTFGRNIGGGQGLTFGQCMDLCMKEDSGDCRSVTWSPTTDRADGINCAMWAHGGFSTVEAEAGSNHAFLVEAPYQDQPDDEIELCSTECPGAHNQVFTSEYGETFLMQCGKRHGTPGQSQFVDSYEQCMNACGMLVQCSSVDYHHRTGRCTFSDHGGEPKIEAPAYASAYSMGCSGACKDYPKPKPTGKDKLCPAPEGKYHGAFWAIDNKAWETRCSLWNHSGTSYILDAGPIPIEDCMKKCQNDTKCKWGNYELETGKCLGITKTWTTTAGIDGSRDSSVNFQPITPPI